MNYWSVNPALNQTAFAASRANCSASKTLGVANMPVTYSYVAVNNATALAVALKSQPIVVGISASSLFFQFYSSGIIGPGSCGVTPNHIVLLVGLGVDAYGIPYWLIKNSFSTRWGESGYARIYRDMNYGYSGVCAINTYALYPIV